MSKRPKIAIQEMSIGELADKTGVTRRVVRFYVQRELIPPPHGKGRGSFYTLEHLDLINQIQEFQAAGYSLDTISELIQQSVIGKGVKATPEQLIAGRADVEGLTPKTESGYQLSGKGKLAPRHIQRRAQVRIKDELWKRVTLLPGVELNIDVSRHDLSESNLEKLKQAAISVVIRSGN